MLNFVLRDPSILDGLDLTEEEKGELIDNINRRLTPQAVKIRAGIRRVSKVASSLLNVTKIWQLVFASLRRHRGGVLWLWRHRCSEGCSESWTQLLHRSHAHQGSRHFSHIYWATSYRLCYYSMNHCLILDRSTWLPHLAMWWPQPLWSAQRACRSLTRPWLPSRRRLRRSEASLTSRWRYMTHTDT